MGDSAGTGKVPVPSLPCASWMLEQQQSPDMAEGWPHLRAAEDKGQSGSMDDSGDVDESLTNLNWLHDFTMPESYVGISPLYPSGRNRHNYRHIPSFASPCSPLAADPACMGLPYTPCKSTSTSRTAHMAMPAQPTEEIDYKTNPHVKPPYSYATLIFMAIEASKKSKITLSDIYKWIADTFCYFRHADPTWQNSIRHNLSLNKCFIKVPRGKDEPGKGGFWMINPQYADQLMNGTFKKRRMPPMKVHSASTSKAQQNPCRTTSPQTPTQTTTTVFNVNVESQKLLKEFEEVTGNQGCNRAEVKAGHKHKQFSPKRTAKGLSSPDLFTPEEQTELGLLKGDFDLGAIFDANLNGELTFDDLDLTPSNNPIRHDVKLMGNENNIDNPQEQNATWPEQALTEPNLNNLDFDETFLATSFLQDTWDESKNEYLPGSVSTKPLFEFSEASLLADLSEWGPLESLL